ncbi:L-dopachrome tautomerase-related protein [Bradyrhizobium sp. 2S1]|uniref:L-dopachrome tautomerase-related protein n=2 Tax=unclassified Bradyrhizobium TaxID=2631580 RepID=UPI001AEDEDA2|nr:L-dopachrome tautomerase-related protein [Bradyrhizobium sp. 2S1]MCK7669082.1 major royal jelly family protein [Bradyrhizobium sp. 2S1]
MKRGILLIAAMTANVLLSAARADEPAVRAEIVARLPESVGNIAITPDNQLIFSHHPFFSPEIRVAKLTSPTTFQPFPSAEWNTPRKGTDQYLDNVLGLRSDENGVVWIIDMGFRTNITPKLVGWNTRSDRLERIYYMPDPVTRTGSQPQDIVIDQKHRKFYIADENIGPGGDGSHAAIIIIDMDTGRARRVLDGDRSTIPEDLPITVDGKDLTVSGKDGKPSIIKVGCDGITMDVRSEWVYFAPLSGRSIYRVRVADLNDEKLTPSELSARVERYSDKPNNGGLSIDYAGNLYLTAVESKSVGVIGADRKYRTYLSDAEMVWPDGITASADGYMYVSASQISAAAMFHGGKGENKAPYLIYRFKPLAAGYVSR